MKKTKKQSRRLALALCLCMLASVFPRSGISYAAETGCNHKHDTAVCGYIEAAEGAPCAFTHKHDDACGYAEAKEAAPCSIEAAHTVHDASCGGPDTGEGCAFTHKHDDACGYSEAKESAPCSIEAAHTVHDESCGYIKAAKGQACTHSHDESCGGLQARAGGQSIAAAALPGASQSGAGYVFDENTLKLTVTTNEGTTAWRKDGILPPSVQFVEFGDQVTAIGDNAFLNCGNLKPITLPAGLTSIGDSAFRDTTLLSMDIPAGVEHIGGGAFASRATETIRVDPGNQHFISVDNVLYSKNMDTLYAYPKNKAGAAVTIPDSVKHIEDWVFTEYVSLESVTFPAGLESIGDQAFYICTGLRSADLSGCAGLTSIGDWAFEGCSQLTSVQLPAGLKSIGERAFWSNSFQSVNIPASVEHIGEGALASIGLESIHIEPGNRHFITEDGVLYNTAMDTLYCYPAKKTGDAFTIPDSVERIGDGAFRSCRSLTSVTFPSGLKSMGESAFAGSGLQSADLSGCAGLTAIEDNVFASCWWLASVALPSGLKSIGKQAFSSSPLPSVDLSGCAGLESIGEGAFLACQSLTSVTFPVGLKSIGEEAFEQCSVLTSVTFPAGLKSIGREAFVDCHKMTAIRFTGDVPPKINVFGGSGSVEIYYPAGARGYMDAGWRISAGFFSRTFIEIYRLTVERGVDETGGGPYDPGDRVTIAADTGPGKTFVGWRGGDDSVFAAGSREEIRTTIIMPAEHLTLTVAYAEDEIKHSHDFSGWRQDEGYHWRACACGDIADKAAHDFGGWVTDKKPTEATSGSRHRDCNTCGYRQTGSIAPAGPDYAYRTLTDEASGIQVSGLFTASAALAVKEASLHAEGGCDVCDDIRERQKNGELIVLFDIALKSGKYTGELEVEIPVGERYNGQTAVMLHCKDKVPESRTVTVENGIAKGTFSGLSPYAVAKVPGSTAITGLPESDTLLVGRTVSWTPAPAGGEWRYDKSLLEMTKDGDTYTFKALKEGKATATYTVDGVPHTVTITVTDKSSTIPQTDDMGNLWLWMLPALAALLGCGGLLLYKKRSRRV